MEYHLAIKCNPVDKYLLIWKNNQNKPLDEKNNMYIMGTYML